MLTLSGSRSPFTWHTIAAREMLGPPLQPAKYASCAGPALNLRALVPNLVQGRAQGQDALLFPAPPRTICASQRRAVHLIPDVTRIVPGGTTPDPLAEAVEGG